MFEDWILIHVAYLITFVALAIRDVLFLRIVLSVANILQIVYQYGFNNHPDIALWNGLFLVVNAIQVFKLIRERSPIKIPDEIEDIYERIEAQANIDGENLRVAAFAAFIAEREKKETRPMGAFRLTDLEAGDDHGLRGHCAGDGAGGAPMARYRRRYPRGRAHGRRSAPHPEKGTVRRRPVHRHR